LHQTDGNHVSRDVALNLRGMETLATLPLKLQNSTTILPRLLWNLLYTFHGMPSSLPFCIFYIHFKILLSVQQIPRNIWVKYG